MSPSSPPQLWREWPGRDRAWRAAQHRTYCTSIVLLAWYENNQLLSNSNNTSTTILRMLPHDKHTCTFRIVYTLYVCNKRINTQLQSMWILNKPWWKEQNIGIPECGRERCGKIFDYASSKICTTSPFASKIFASPTLCVYPFLSLVAAASGSPSPVTATAPSHSLDICQLRTTHFVSENCCFAVDGSHEIPSQMTHQ